MANSTVTDFTIYDPTFHAGQVESLAENIALFGSALAMNGGRAPAINLRSRNINGFYERTTNFKLPSNTISRRDPTDMSAATDAWIEDVEHVGVKVASRIGPFLDTYDKFIKRGNSIEMQSFVVGQATGEYMFQDYITTALSSVIAAINNQAGTPMVLDISDGANGQLDQAALINAKRLMGDQAARLNTIVCSSGPYFDVMADSYTANKATVADLIVNAGANPTLGMPSVVTDNSVLSFVDVTNKNYVLLLADDAVRVTESEGRARMYMQQVLGLENVALRLQGEHSYNLDIKGTAWDMANGGASPNNAALATATNWDAYATSPKNGPGVLIICDATTP